MICCELINLFSQVFFQLHFSVVFMHCIPSDVNMNFSIDLYTDIDLGFRLDWI